MGILTLNIETPETEKLIRALLERFPEVSIVEDNTDYTQTGAPMSIDAYNKMISTSRQEVTEGKGITLDQFKEISGKW